MRRMSALEDELSRRARKLLAITREVDFRTEVSLEKVKVIRGYSTDGDDEFVIVSLGGQIVYEELNGERLRPAVHFIDRIHMAVLEMRKHMLLDDIADGVEPPIDSILERDEL